MVLLARRLADEGLGAASGERIVPRGTSASPLSYAQEVLWLVDRASPGLAAYNVAMAYRLRGPLEVAHLTAALTALVERHEILRTVFVAAGANANANVLPATELVLAFDDVTALPLDERDGAASALLQAYAETPFDLTAAAFRPVLIRVGDDNHRLMLLTHHIITDAWSYTILFDELATLYDAKLRGIPAPLAPIPLHFGDYAAWQRPAGRPARGLGYWGDRLRDVEPLALPTDRHDSRDAGYAGAHVARTISPRANMAVRALCERFRVTTYMVLLAAWQTLLYRSCGQDDIVVGSAVSGRTRRETETMVGYFAQALPMRTSFAGDPTFAEALQRVSETVVGAFEHQDVPLEALLIEAHRTGSHAPLFRSVLTMAEATPSTPAFGPATAEPIDVDLRQTKFDLTLFPGERDGTIDLKLWFRTALYDDATALRMLRQLERILESAGEDAQTPVSRIDILSIEERTELAKWNTTATMRALFDPIHIQVTAHAAQTPDAVALVAEDGTLTYAQLDVAANRLAHYLRALGVERGQRVAVALDRSSRAVVAALAVMKAGAAYVPVAAEGPPARLARQLSESDVSVVVADSCDAERLAAARVRRLVCLDRDAATIAAFPTSAPAGHTAADDLAYVLFTSGSTGVPKGVAVSNGNIAAYAAAIAQRLDTTSPLRFATVSTLTADLGYTSVFAALHGGATLYVVPGATVLDSAAFASYVQRNAIDVLKITPSHLQALLDGAADAREILPRGWLVLGGEPCPWELADRVAAIPGAPRLLNHYGPTETTVGACTFEITPASATRARALGARTVPIGMPLAHATTHVLDGQRQLLPVGATGELWIGGAGVAAGYIARDDLTEERFLTLPGAGRAYRTGDRVRRLATGDLEFIGRADRQVKIRGFRVELREIEAALESCTSVARAVVTVHADSGTPACVAYLVAKPGIRSTGFIDDVRSYARTALPEYMIPAAYVVLDRIPLTPNGKIDVAGLPRLEGPDMTKASAFATPTEHALARIWIDALRCEHAEPDDDFFALGGHSLAAIRVLGTISREFRVRLPLRALFDAPVLRDLARMVDERRSLAREEPAPIVAVPRRLRPVRNPAS